jgi:hypothetical protein
VDELGALLRDVRREAGDPVEVVEVLMEDRLRGDAMIEARPLGEVECHHVPIRSTNSGEVIRSLEQQAQDVGLEQLPQGDDVGVRRRDEIPLGGERPRRRQDVQVGVPVQVIPRRLARVQSGSIANAVSPLDGMMPDRGDREV